MALGYQKKGREEELEEDESYTGMDEDELEEDETEMLEQEEKTKNKPSMAPAMPKGRGRPPKETGPMQRPSIPGRPVRETRPVEVKERYTVFAQPQRFGIVDSETNEVIAEGDLANLQALANIIERLERMEATIGSMIGGN